MIKQNKRLSLFIMHALLSLFFALSFLTGVSLAFQNKEKTSFENAHLYSSINTPHSTLVFEYKTKGHINDSAVWQYVKFANDFDGEKKYYNYGCLWSETNELSFTSDKYSFKSVVSDLSYLENRPSFSTNLLQLTYPNDYSIAFYESKTSYYFEYDSYKVKEGDKLFLKIRKAHEIIENDMVEWSSSDYNIATIDSNGCIEGINPGECIINAKINDISLSTIIVISNRIEKSELVKFIPAVVPLSIASEIGDGEPKNSIGKTFKSTDKDLSTTFIIGGYYDNIPTQSVFRNKLYFDNFGERIYVLRNDSFVEFRPNRILLTVGSKNKVNMNMYSDIQYLKKNISLSFDIPNDCAINQATNSSLKFKTIYQCIDFIKSTSVLVFGILLLLFSLCLMVLDCVVLKKHHLKIKSIIPLFYIFGIIVPLVLLLLLNKIPIFGIRIFLVNNIGGVFLTIVSFVISVIILFLSKEKRNKIENIFCSIDI